MCCTQFSIVLSFNTVIFKWMSTGDLLKPLHEYEPLNVLRYLLIENDRVGLLVM